MPSTDRSRATAFGNAAALLLLLALAAAGCSEESSDPGASVPADPSARVAAEDDAAAEDLVGCYSFEQGGAARLRVTRRDDQYSLAYKKSQGEAWPRAAGAQFTTHNQQAVLVGDSAATEIRVGLMAGAGVPVFLKAAPGTRLNGEKSPSGYFAHRTTNEVFGTDPLYEVPCP